MNAKDKRARIEALTAKLTALQERAERTEGGLDLRLLKPEEVELLEVVRARFAAGTDDAETVAVAELLVERMTVQR